MRSSANRFSGRDERRRPLSRPRRAASSSAKHAAVTRDALSRGTSDSVTHIDLANPLKAAINICVEIKYVTLDQTNHNRFHQLDEVFDMNFESLKTLVLFRNFFSFF
jgi:hypothetical protein